MEESEISKFIIDIIIIIKTADSGGGRTSSSSHRTLQNYDYATC